MTDEMWNDPEIVELRRRASCEAQHRRDWKRKYEKLVKGMKPVKTGLLEICRGTTPGAKLHQIAAGCLKHLEDV